MRREEDEEEEEVNDAAAAEEVKDAAAEEEVKDAAAENEVKDAVAEQEVKDAAAAAEEVKDAAAAAAEEVKDAAAEEEVKDATEEEEEEDVDFNPFLMAAAPTSPTSEEEEASSHLNSEDDDNGGEESPSLSSKCPVDSSTSDAICRRTRARHSLADRTLDELEAFLQESDDDDDQPNPLDDREEYRKFLAAVLGHEDDPDDASDADVDFELEIEEALESDEDDNTKNEISEDLRCPETRQKNKSQRTQQKPPIVPSLRPILPSLAGPSSPPVPPLFPRSTFEFQQPSGFLDAQIGQLHCLIHEHVQLLLQIFSLCVLDPKRQQVAADLRGLILEMVDKRREALAQGKAAHPVSCFANLHEHQSHQSSDHASWTPAVNQSLVSVLDVPSLTLAGEFLGDVSVAVSNYRGYQIEGTGRSELMRVPLFPLPDGASVEEVNNDAMEVTKTCQDAMEGSRTCQDATLDSQNKPKKSLAAVLVEKTRKQSIALVPQCITDLAGRFVPLFNSMIFPRKPPGPAIANRILFTDSEDELLAMGLMEYSNDWGAIQQRFLPCKSKHQIFVRQKNRSSSKAPENPIKAVRRMKTSPLTANEMALVSKGLKAFKNDWNAIWRFFMPYRDPSLLPRQWRMAIGTQKSYRKSEIVREKRRVYEAERRRHKNLLNRRLSAEKDIEENERNLADDNANGEGEAYVHEAFLAVPNPESSRTMPVTRECALPQPQNTVKVVKLAPGLPPVNLPPSVRVISRSAFRTYHRTPPFYSQIGNRNFSAGPPLAGETGNEGTGSKFIVSSSHTNDMSMLDPTSRGDSRPAEESNLGSEFMHPLLFQAPEDGYPEYYSSNGSEHLPRYYPNVQMHGQSDRSMELPQTIMQSKEASLHLQTIDFHPLLQRMEDTNSSFNVSFINSKRPNSLEPIQKHCLSFRDVTSGSQISQGHLANPACSATFEKENNLDLNIRLYSATNKGNSVTQKGIDSNGRDIPGNGTAEDSQLASPFTNNKGDHTTTVIQSDMGSSPCGKSRVSGLIKMAVPRDAACRSTPNETEDEFLTEIVMEQEELSDTDEDIENVEFECEEMDDSGEEQEGEHPSDAQEQGVSTFPGGADVPLQNSNDSGNSAPHVQLCRDTCTSPSSKPKTQKKGKKVEHASISRKESQTCVSSHDSLMRKRSKKGSKSYPLKRPKLQLGTINERATGSSRRQKKDGSK